VQWCSKTNLFLLLCVLLLFLFFVAHLSVPKWLQMSSLSLFVGPLKTGKCNVLRNTLGTSISKCLKGSICKPSPFFADLDTISQLGPRKINSGVNPFFSCNPLDMRFFDAAQLFNSLGVVIRNSLLTPLSYYTYNLHIRKAFGSRKLPPCTAVYVLVFIRKKGSNSPFLITTRFLFQHLFCPIPTPGTSCY